MEQQVLALKWRPRDFHEVVGQPHVVKALINGLDNNRLHHAFLFTGTRGVGKTTLARIFAKCLNCEVGVSSEPCGECSICLSVDEGSFVDLIEIDAASRTKVEDTREILDNVPYAPTRGRYKIYLIDEVHMLSHSSFNALLKTLEEPPPHVKFLLATTDPQKLPITVLSRCLRLQLRKIDVATISKQLKFILKAEAIPFEASAIELIARAGQGSMRDALSILDQAIAYTNSHITFTDIQTMLGLIDTQYVEKILSGLASFSAKELLEVLEELREIGLNYEILLEALITAFHHLTLLKIDDTFIAYDIPSPEVYLQLKERLTAEDLQLFYQIALQGRKDLYQHPQIELGFEMTLLRMLLFLPASEKRVQKKSAQLERDSIEKNHQKIHHQENSYKETTSKETQTEKAAKPSALEDALEKKESANLSYKAQLEAPDDSFKSPVVGSMAEEPDVEALVAKEMFLEEPLVDGSLIDKSLSDQSPINKPLIDKTRVAKTLAEEVAQGQDLSLVEDFTLAPFTETSPYKKKEPIDNTLTSHLTDLLPVKEEVSQREPNNSSKPTHTALEGRDVRDKTERLEKVREEEGRAEEVREHRAADITIITNDDWLSILEKVRLDSLLKGFASSLTFVSFVDGLLTLNRLESERDFNINEASIRLGIALSNYLKTPIKCKIIYIAESSRTGDESLYQRHDRLAEETLQATKKDFEEDPVVRYLVEELEGQLIEESITIKKSKL